jgi:predicted nucleic acid-binding protein
MAVSRIFWDTNLFIYLIEGHGALADRVAELRERMLARGDKLLTSALTLGELLVKPAEQGRDDLVEAYEHALTEGAEIIAFDRDAAMHYARVRRDRAIRPPDAIQLACAASIGIDLFITNDDRLSRKSIPGIHFITGLDRVPF